MPNILLQYRIAVRAGLMLLALTTGVSADEIGLETGVYDWPNKVPYTISIQNPGGNPRQLLYHLFQPTEDPLATTLYPDLSVSSRDGREFTPTIDTTNLLNYRAADPFREYRVPVLMEKLGGQFTVLDSKRLLALRALSPIPEEAITWLFEDGATFNLMSIYDDRPDLPAMASNLPESTGLAPGLQKRRANRIAQYIDFFRLGRRMPGGAVEVDYDPSRVPFKPAVEPVTLVQIGDAERAKRLRLFSQHVGYPSDPRLGDALRPRRPMEFGDYEVRVVGLGGAIMARRNFSVRRPSLNGSLSLEPGNDDGYETPPAIVVTLPAAVHESRQAYALSLRVQRVLADQTYERVETLSGVSASGGTIGGAPDYDPAKPRTVFTQRGNWQPGTYRATLVWQHDGLLADEIRFEIKQRGDRDRSWPVALEPSLTTDDVKVTLRGDDIQVRGPHIGFDVMHAEKQEPLDTGPLVGELYRLGHYTYDCAWLEGYYTGGSALITEEGFGQIPSPIEAGRYELRVFRPMVSFLDIGAHDTDLGVTFASPGSSSTQTMQLIGRERLTVRASRYDGIIQGDAFEPDDMGRALNIAIQSPGPMVEGHTLRLEAWHGAEQVPGGFQRHQYQDKLSAGIAFDDGDRGANSMVIDRFPFAATLLPIQTPGNYELRIFDETTGLYIARRHLVFRDPGPPAMPEHAMYGTGLPGDWPADGDSRRGVAAWYKERSECADPEFETPPELEIVEYVIDEPDERSDGEFRPVANVLTGNPYFVRATFEEAPADEEYLVRLNGERRITIYRTTDDPKVYRSAVLRFSEQIDE